MHRGDCCLRRDSLGDCVPSFLRTHHSHSHASLHSHNNSLPHPPCPPASNKDSSLAPLIAVPLPSDSSSSTPLPTSSPPTNLNFPNIILIQAGTNMTRTRFSLFQRLALPERSEVSRKRSAMIGAVSR